MNKIYIIAETACSHDGSVNLLKKLIREAIKANFQAIQLQIWDKNFMVSKDHKDYNLLKNVEISYKNWSYIIKYIRKLSSKIDIICCVYELKTLNFCIKNKIKFFKIHSSDLGNFQLLEKVSKHASRIDLSVGGSTINEIEKSIKYIKKFRISIWLMYGIQLFPTDPKKINISLVKKIAKKYNLKLGYQDHSDFDLNGYAMPAAAIGNGIKIIEKHITDENKKNRTDGASAIEIKNYKTFIDICKNSENLILNKNSKKLSNDELKYRNYSKKQILYKQNFPKGTLIKEENLIFLRTSKKGEIVDNLHLFLNKKLIKSVRKLSNLKKKDFA
jgi:sialic acid synthase SpsE